MAACSAVSVTVDRHQTCQQMATGSQINAWAPDPVASASVGNSAKLTV